MMNTLVTTKCRLQSILSRSALIAAALIGMAGIAGAQDKEATASLEKLPPHVRDAVQLAIKGGEVEKVELESKAGKTIYEIKSEVEGGTVELSYNDTGQLIEIEVANAESEEEGEEAGADEEKEEHEENNNDGHARENQAHENGGEVAKDISIDAVPKAAADTIRKHAGNAKLTAVESVTEAGATVYEAAWKVDAVTNEVTVSAAGDVISEETVLTMAQLPPVAREIAQRFAGGAQLKLERKSMVVYEIEIVKSDKDAEIVVDAAGRKVNVEFARHHHENKEEGEHEDHDRNEHDEE